MVDLESHRIIDIIDTREATKVAEWLKTYPNIEIISTDGAQAYSSASSNSHPEAIQISDRFHLLKNLSEAVERYMRRLFPSRLEIPATATTQSPQM
jgi:transposase|nr:transposase [uncultured Lachnoclostridium sp.]